MASSLSVSLSGFFILLCTVINKDYSLFDFIWQIFAFCETSYIFLYLEKHRSRKADLEESQPGTSAQDHKSNERLKKTGKTSSKEKRLVRGTATCDDAETDSKDQNGLFFAYALLTISFNSLTVS